MGTGWPTVKPVATSFASHSASSSAAKSRASAAMPIWSSRVSAAVDDAEWLVKLVATGFTVGQPVPIFPRLELPEGTDENGGEGEA